MTDYNAGDIGNNVSDEPDVASVMSSCSPLSKMQAARASNLGRITNHNERLTQWSWKSFQ